jgi:uncharacterized protein YceH (UPF0502 family)
MCFISAIVAGDHGETSLWKSWMEGAVMFTEAIHAWLPTVIAGGALALIWTDVRNTKRQLSAKFDELTVAFKKALYRDDGTANYMHRSNCEREQARCQSITCGKIESISVKMDLMDSKMEHAKEQHSAQLGDVRQALAVLSERVEQLSKDVSLNIKRGGTNEQTFSK